MTFKRFRKTALDFPYSEELPVLFVGHGSPMNAIEENEFSRGWMALGEKLPRPSAILSLSAHWLTDGTYVHVSDQPKTIYDFWGFPEELYRVRYDCPGSSEYAKKTQALIRTVTVEADTSWGLDHGTWIVLRRLFPKADIPVFQMSVDFPKPGIFHYELGKELVSLRRRGVLIIASGNIVHNLGRISAEAGSTPYEWALEFDEHLKALLEAREDSTLIAYEKMGRAARLSVPTPDHYFPLLYALAATRKNEAISFPIQGFSFGSVSMRTVLFGKRFFIHA